MLVTALKRRGWSISAIARHLEKDRKTIRSYLRREAAGQDSAVRAKPAGYIPSIEPYRGYLVARFVDDPHVWGTVLFDEVVKLGYPLSYQSFTRELRRTSLRPKCVDCMGVKSRYTTEISHPPGDEMQFDFLELPASGLGATTHVLVGTLAFSSQARCVILEAETRGHLIYGLDAIVRQFGGTANKWRFDNAAALKGTYGKGIATEIRQMAKHYGVEVVLCEAYSPQRKGVVEKFNDYLTQRWWRTARLGDALDAQADLRRFCETVADARKRPASRLLGIGISPGLDARGRYISPTVAGLAELENLKPLPEHPYPATVKVDRVVSSSSLVAYQGNFYSVSLGEYAKKVHVTHHLSDDTLEITSGVGNELARHRLATAGAGLICRSEIHAIELSRTILASKTPRRPHHKKANLPPSDTSLAQAALLGGTSRDLGDIDLGRYERLALMGAHQ